MSNQLKLRGHHLLCLLAFRGKGYDSAFISNLKKLQERIKKEKNIKIKITDGPDDICSACPHLKKSICCIDAEDSESKTRSMDNNVLKKLNLDKDSNEIELSAIIKALENTEENEIRELCAACPWLQREDCPQAIRLFIHSVST